MRISCVNVATANIVEMREFYSIILNTPYYERNACRDEIPIENVCVVITSSETKAPINPDSCGLEFIVDHLDEEYSRLLAAGIKIENPPVTLPWDYKYFAVKDPDGNNIDFVQYVGQDNRP